jgi:DNA-binding NarL/FixJ family response regulator
VVLRSESDAPLVAEWRHRVAGCPIVAVLPTLRPALVERVIAAGAAGVIGCCANPEELAETVHAAIAGKTVLPYDVVRGLTADAERARGVSTEERAWLKALADGATVADLAGRFAYSERQLYRRLGALYGRLGAGGKTEALLRAERAGLLDD